MSQTIYEKCGRVKRKYPTDDFNPFTAMEAIYNSCLHAGTGHTILVTGYTERFVKEIWNAWLHVMVAKNLVSGSDKPPVLEGDEFVTHTGARLRFEVHHDNADGQMGFYESAKTASIILLCSEYKSPDFLNILKEVQVNSTLYRAFDNNLKKS